MNSIFGFLSKKPDTPDTKKEDKKGISENDLIGKGSYKKVYSIKNDDDIDIDNSSFMVDKDFKTVNHVIAIITTNKWKNREANLENLQEELKIQVDLAADNRAVNVLQIKYNFKGLEPCNIIVSSSEDINKTCDAMRDNIANLEEISILMEKCEQGSSYNTKNTIERDFNDLIDYLVDDKNIMLMDIKPDNVCIYQNKLIALDLDPQFIIQNIQDDEAKEAAKACMFLIFSINLFINSRGNDPNRPFDKISAHTFIQDRLEKYFDIKANNRNWSKYNPFNNPYKSILDKINFKFDFGDNKNNVPTIIRHYYYDVPFTGRIDADITQSELKIILNKIKTIGGRKNKRKTQKKQNKNKKKTQKKRP
jgi:hypothetical protein